MSIRDLFGRRAATPAPDAPPSDAPVPPAADVRTVAQAWLEAMERGELNIPADRRDPAAWDRYWRKQMEVGAIDQSFSDVMSSDPTLITALRNRPVKSILCAGIGLSAEAFNLALH